MPAFVEQGDGLGEIALLVIRARERWRELKRRRAARLRSPVSPPAERSGEGVEHGSGFGIRPGLPAVQCRGPARSVQELS